MRTRFSAEHEARRADKLSYRYPRGESYRDLIGRVEPVIVELERTRRPILIVSHQAVLRVIYAYLMDRPEAQVPYIPIPLHTVFELTPVTYGCLESTVTLPPRRSVVA